MDNKSRVTCLRYLLTVMSHALCLSSLAGLKRFAHNEKIAGSNPARGTVFVSQKMLSGSRTCEYFCEGSIKVVCGSDFLWVLV